MPPAAAGRPAEHPITPLHADRGEVRRPASRHQRGSQQLPLHRVQVCQHLYGEQGHWGRAMERRMACMPLPPARPRAGTAADRTLPAPPPVPPCRPPSRSSSSCCSAPRTAFRPSGRRMTRACSAPPRSTTVRPLAPPRTSPNNTPACRRRNSNCGLRRSPMANKRHACESS